VTLASLRKGWLQHSRSDRAMAHVADSEPDSAQAHLTQAIIDAMPEHIAILAPDGTILAVNAAWRAFARQNGDPNSLHTDIGVNYFAICEAATAPEGIEAISALQGMRAVLQGDLERFEMEYPCHSPDRERWFVLQVTPLRNGDAETISGLLVRHVEITERVLSARAAWQARRSSAIDSVARLSLSPAPTTSELFGTTRLSETAPELFANLASEYRHLIDQAVEQRIFGEEKRSSERLRHFAAKLGALHIGPRDVIELHVHTMRGLISDEHSLRAEACAEEGRLAVLELMGYLVAFYRTYALGILRSPPAPFSKDY